MTDHITPLEDSSQFCPVWMSGPEKCTAYFVYRQRAPLRYCTCIIWKCRGYLNEECYFRRFQIVTNQTNCFINSLKPERPSPLFPPPSRIVVSEIPLFHYSLFPAKVILNTVMVLFELVRAWTSWKRGKAHHGKLFRTRPVPSYIYIDLFSCPSSLLMPCWCLQSGHCCLVFSYILSLGSLQRNLNRHRVSSSTCWSSRLRSYPLHHLLRVAADWATSCESRIQGFETTIEVLRKESGDRSG